MAPQEYYGRYGIGRRFSKGCLRFLPDDSASDEATCQECLDLDSSRQGMQLPAETCKVEALSDDDEEDNRPLKRKKRRRQKSPEPKIEADQGEEPGRRFNRKRNWLEFWLEKRIEILF